MAFFLHPYYSETVTETDLYTQSVNSGRSIPNIAVGEFGVLLQRVALHLKQGAVSVCTTGISNSIKSIGGVATLLPLLDYASSINMYPGLSGKICKLLGVIGRLLNGVHGAANTTDLKRLDGFRIMAYLMLRAAEKDLVNEGVVDSIFELIADGSSDNCLVADRDVAEHLLLNHVILFRGCSRYSKLRLYLLEKLDNLVNRSSLHSGVNTVILIAAKIIPWLLHSMVSDAQSIDGVGSVLREQTMQESDVSNLINAIRKARKLQK